MLSCSCRRPFRLTSTIKYSIPPVRWVATAGKARASDANAATPGLVSAQRNLRLFFAIRCPDKELQFRLPGQADRHGDLPRLGAAGQYHPHRVGEFELTHIRGCGGEPGDLLVQ